MKDQLATNSPVKHCNSETNSATRIILNTHCIVCGTAFHAARMSKLYCSPRCKQFGYNHKLEISQALAFREKGISPIPLSFFIDDYTVYNKTQKLLKRFRELKKKKQNWEEANQELILKEKYGLSVSNYIWDQFTSKKLTDDDELELNEAENNLPEEILGLNLKEFSLEQWSFIKSLYPNLDDTAFFEISDSLSDNFIRQMSLNKISSDNIAEELIIKNKFINHCNLIAMGKITFNKKEKAKGDSL